jgi:hypothetical protein
VQTFGFALVAAAALFALLRAALLRSRAAAFCVAAAFAALLGLGAGVDGYNNVRVVALEVPITEARSLLETAAADGALDGMPAGSSLVFSMKDTNWNTGKFLQVPGAFESMLVDRTGRVYDARVPAPEDKLGCPRGTDAVPTECASLSDSTAWVRFRGRRGGGSVIVGRVVRPSSTPYGDVVRDLRVYARGDGDPPPPPQLVATARDGSPWTSADVRWRLVDSGDSWAIYEGSVDRGPLPVGDSLDDAAAQVDFTQQGTPEQIVRIYGTKSLLP